MDIQLTEEQKDILKGKILPVLPHTERIQK